MDTKTLSNRRTRRTTLTLEADVADYIQEKLARNKNLKEKNVVNDLIRKGISQDVRQTSTQISIKGFRSKFADGVSLESVEKELDKI